MPALAALVLLASSTTTMHVEDVFPGTMVCPCTPTPSSAVPASAVTEEPSYWRSPTAWTIASGATSLVLIGGAICAHPPFPRGGGGQRRGGGRGRARGGRPRPRCWWEGRSWPASRPPSW